MNKSRRNDHGALHWIHLLRLHYLIGLGNGDMLHKSKILVAKRMLRFC